MKTIPATMRALVAHSADSYCFEAAWPTPEIGPEDILLRVEACGICAGDLKARQGAARFWGGDGMPGYCEPPFIPGHEFVGHIAAVGERRRDAWQVGERIVAEQILPCGHCRYCRQGQYWLCDPHDVYGFRSSLNGGMAEYVRLPANALLYRVPEEFTRAEAALIEPFACSLHAVRRSAAGVDDVVVLAGAGTLGLGMVSALRQRNPKQLIVLDLNEKRLERARACGANLTLNPAKEDVIARVLELTDGYGCDVYIEATGHPSAVGQGLEMIRKAGRFIEFSVFGAPATVDWSIIGDAKELTLLGSSLSPYCYEPTIAGIAAGTRITEGIVTHEFSLEAWEAAFETAAAEDSIKVLIVP